MQRRETWGLGAPHAPEPHATAACSGLSRRLRRQLEVERIRLINLTRTWLLLLTPLPPARQSSSLDTLARAPLVIHCALVVGLASLVTQAQAGTR